MCCGLWAQRLISARTAHEQHSSRLRELQNKVQAAFALACGASERLPSWTASRSCTEVPQRPYRQWQDFRSSWHSAVMIGTHREDNRQRNTKTAAVCRAKRRLVLFERVWRLPALFAWGFKRWQWWCIFSSFLYKLSFVCVTRGKKYHKWDLRYHSCMWHKVTCNTNHKINCSWFISVYKYSLIFSFFFLFFYSSKKNI